MFSRVSCIQQCLVVCRVYNSGLSCALYTTVFSRVPCIVFRVYNMGLSCALCTTVVSRVLHIQVNFRESYLLWFYGDTCPFMGHFILYIDKGCHGQGGQGPWVAIR